MPLYLVLFVIFFGEFSTPPLNLREGRRGRSREKLWGRKRRRRRRRRRELRVMADAPACTPPPIPPPPPRLEASSNGPAEIFPPPAFLHA